MVTHLDHRRKHPCVFQHPTGLTVAMVDAPAADVVPVVEVGQRKDLDCPDRLWAGDTFDLCGKCSILRAFVRAASGRQRFDVPCVWDTVTRALVSVTNTTVVNTDTTCELLRKIAVLELAGPAAAGLNNAKRQRNKVRRALAAELSIYRYRPGDAPNRNFIERLRRFLKRKSV